MNEDTTAVRYEALRHEFLTHTAHRTDGDWVRFSASGLLGLLPCEPAIDYVVEVHPARLRRWWGRIDPREQALLEAFRLLTGHLPLCHPHPGDHLDEGRFVCSRLDEESGEARHHCLSG